MASHGKRSKIEVHYNNKGTKSHGSKNAKGIKSGEESYKGSGVGYFKEGPEYEILGGRSCRRVIPGLYTPVWNWKERFESFQKA